MATKKKNRSYVKRKVRRILNRSLNSIEKMSGKFLNSIGYGSGPGNKSFREKESNDDRQTN